MNDSDPTSDEKDQQPPSFLQVVGSALAAAFGVQSSRNRERDFTRGKLSHFIVVGVGLTILFVVLLIAVVNLVLSNVS